MQLTERDVKVVVAVYHSRFLNAHQIEAQFFSSRTGKVRSRKQACQRRLQLLYHHGFLDRLPMPVVLGQGRSPYVYALDEVGANLVATQLGIDRPMVAWKPADNQVKPLFLDHTIAVNNVRVVVHSLIRDHAYELVKWVEEARLKSAGMRDKVPYRVRGTRRTRIYPDGYFAIRLPSAKQPAHFFLEADQGTMTNSRWQEKIQAYLHFRRSGLSHQHFNTRNFRLLTVTTSERRLANLKQASEAVGADRYFWFTSQDQVDIWNPSRLLEPVWQVAGRTQMHPLFA